MPLHDLRCEAGHVFESFIPLAMFGGAQEALRFTCHCGATAQIVHLRAPMLATDLPGYQSPVDGRWVEGKRARREDLARNNCVPYEPSMKQEYMRKVERSEQALDKALDQQIEAEIHQLPARKRELLEQELKSGTDLQLTRA